MVKEKKNWTAEEDAYLLECLSEANGDPRAFLKQLADVLPHRTPSAAYGRLPRAAVVKGIAVSAEFLAALVTRNKSNGAIVGQGKFCVHCQTCGAWTPAEKIVAGGSRE